MPGIGSIEVGNKNIVLDFLLVSCMYSTYVHTCSTSRYTHEAPIWIVAAKICISQHQQLGIIIAGFAAKVM